MTLIIPSPAPSKRIAIETQIRDLLLADTELMGGLGSASLKGFVIGEPAITVPYTMHPYCIIFITGQLPTAGTDGETGPTDQAGNWLYEYTGYLSVETQMTDAQPNYDSNKTIVIDSYRAIGVILDVISNRLNRLQRLGGLTSDLGAVRSFELGPKTYGIAERNNNFLNSGTVPFTVETVEPKMEA